MGFDLFTRKCPHNNILRGKENCPLCLESARNKATTKAGASARDLRAHAAKLAAQTPVPASPALPASHSSFFPAVSLTCNLKQIRHPQNAPNVALSPGQLAQMNKDLRPLENFGMRRWRWNWRAAQTFARSGDMFVDISNGAVYEHVEDTDSELRLFCVHRDWCLSPGGLLALTVNSEITQNEIAVWSINAAVLCAALGGSVKFLASDEDAIHSRAMAAAEFIAGKDVVTYYPAQTVIEFGSTNGCLQIKKAQ